MHWKLKSRIQNAVSLLPPWLSYSAYYWIQRHFGGLRQTNPTSKLTAAFETCKRILEQGETPSGKVFLEVGTGRAPVVPIAYWLMGAEKTITVDSNPYLKPELVKESLDYIFEKQHQVAALFGHLMDKARFNDVLRLSRDSPLSLPCLLETCRIDYRAPGDAGETGLPESSIDFHTSYTVFEHIPLAGLERILKEGNRITKSNGLFIHRIDYSDHFSHSDKSLSAINFLQYTEKEWEKLAGNKYMYMNRLRHDDFISLFEAVGQHVLDVQLDTDEQVNELLDDGHFRLNERFSGKSKDVLATTAAWIVSRKNG